MPVVSCVVGFGELAAVIGLPVVGEFGELRLALGLGGCGLVGEELFLNCFGFGGGIDADGFCVELVEERALFDDGVAARLGDGGVVGFVVAVATVADEVDDDVGVEALAILGGDGGDAHGGVGVFAVDVEDGDGQALGEVGGEAGGVRLFGVGGEAEEVVGDDVHGAADAVAGEGGHVERLGGDALAGEGCVAVEDDGKDLLLAFFADADLPGAGAAHGDGVDGFEMAGVGGEVKCDGLASGRGVVAGGSHVVLDVTAAEVVRGSTSSKRAKISEGERPMVLVMTLRRPRCAMAMMERVTPSAEAVAKT